jgi:hypothetical protein
MAVHGNYKINEETQTLDELWESISKLAFGRVNDNKKSKTYPLEPRKSQIDSLIVLANTIKATHEQIESSEE